jgi:hypothetical protein
MVDDPPLTSFARVASPGDEIPLVRVRSKSKTRIGGDESGMREARISSIAEDRPEDEEIFFMKDSRLGKKVNKEGGRL